MPGFEGINDLDNEGGGSSAAEQNDEAFRDQYRQTQQQIAAIKKQEQNARKKDDQLAHVLMRLLQSQTNSGLMILIARCLDHNLPAGFIIGILALTVSEAQVEFEKVMGESIALLAAPPAHDTYALVEVHAFDAGQFPAHVKKALDAWMRGLLEFGLTQPTRLLTTAISPIDRETGEGGELFPALGQLTAMVAQEFLATEGFQFTVETTKPFAENLLKNILLKIHERLGGIKELTDGRATKNV